MKTSDFINDLRTSLSEGKKQGMTTVPISDLEIYLNEMERINNDDDSATAQEIQRQEASSKFEHDMDVWKVNAPLENANNLKMFDSVTEAGLTIIKSTTLINGGAAVSLLAFLGNLMTKNAPYNVVYPIEPISQAMLIFFLGVGFSGIATGARYCSQAFFYAKKISLGYFFRRVVITFVVLSLCAFFYGGVKAYLAIAIPMTS